MPVRTALGVPAWPVLTGALGWLPELAERHTFWFPVSGLTVSLYSSRKEGYGRGKEAQRLLGQICTCLMHWTRNGSGHGVPWACHAVSSHSDHPVVSQWVLFLEGWSSDQLHITWGAAGEVNSLVSPRLRKPNPWGWAISELQIFRWF